MNEDLINLAWEVKNCKHGVAYQDRNQDEARCNALADEIGAARGYHAGVIDLAKQREMVTLCHSPVQADDPEICGGPRLPVGTTAADCSEVMASPWTVVKLADQEFPELYEVCRAALNVRMGDLRYHQVNVIPTPQTPSPWGIYTDSEDPLTGETVSASINVWSWVNDYWSQRVIDKIRYLKGELTTEEITEGEYVRRWSEAASTSTGSGIIGGVDREGINARVADFAGVDPEAFENAQLPTDMQEAVIRTMQELQHVKTSLDAPLKLGRSSGPGQSTLMAVSSRQS